MMLANGQQVALFGLGAESATPSGGVIEDIINYPFVNSPAMRALLVIRGILTPIIIGGAAYHGYKRTDTIRWSVGWAFLAALAPTITTGVMFAQGFGKAKR